MPLTNQMAAHDSDCNGWVGAPIRYNLPTILANASLAAHRQQLKESYFIYISFRWLKDSFLHKSEQGTKLLSVDTLSNMMKCMGVLTNQPSVRMTIRPPRLQHQTLWAEGILTGKMTFWRDEFLARVVCLWCPYHPTTCQVDSMTSSNSWLCGQWASWQGRCHFKETKCLAQFVCTMELSVFII